MYRRFRCRDPRDHGLREAVDPDPRAVPDAVLVRSHVHHGAASAAAVTLAAGLRRVKAAVAFDLAALAVHVARSRPIAQRVVGTGLVAALRHGVKDAVNAENFLAAAAVGRIGVEDFASFVLVEDAAAGEILHRGGPFRRGPEIVERAPRGDLFRLERHMTLIIEFAPYRPHPTAFPTHPLAPHFDLLNHRPVDNGIPHAVLLH